MVLQLLKHPMLFTWMIKVQVQPATWPNLHLLPRQLPISSFTIVLIKTQKWGFTINGSLLKPGLVVVYCKDTCKSSSWPNWWLSNVGRARISSLQHGSYFTKTWGWGFCRNENRPRLIMEQTYVKIEQLQLISWWPAAKLYNISCQICWSDQISTQYTSHNWYV